MMGERQANTQKKTIRTITATTQSRTIFNRTKWLKDWKRKRTNNGIKVRKEWNRISSSTTYKASHTHELLHFKSKSHLLYLRSNRLKAAFNETDNYVLMMFEKLFRHFASLSHTLAHTYTYKHIGRQKTRGKREDQSKWFSVANSIFTEFRSFFVRFELILRFLVVWPASFFIETNSLIKNKCNWFSWTKTWVSASNTLHILVEFDKKETKTKTKKQNY